MNNRGKQRKYYEVDKLIVIMVVQYVWLTRRTLPLFVFLIFELIYEKYKRYTINQLVQSIWVVFLYFFGQDFDSNLHHTLEWPFKYGLS